MSQKKALKIIGILFLVSVIALSIKSVLVRKYPEKFDAKAKYEKTQHDVEKQNAEAAAAAADELPIHEMQIIQTTKNNRNVWSWPYDSTVPIYHNVDLGLYQNKIKDETSLQNITVYLSISADSSEASTESVNDGDQTAKQTDNSDHEMSETDDVEATENSAEDEQVFSSPAQMSEGDYRKILENIQKATQENLEALGAQVVLLDTKYQQDTQKAAFIGQAVLQDFLTELKEQNFKSDRLEKLLPSLQSIASSNHDAAATKTFFPEIGVSADQRLLLDVERQYTDRIFINLKFGQSDAEITGSLVEYLGNQSAAIGAQGDQITEDSNEKPAYIAYDSENRQRLAELTEKNISQLIPGLAYSGDKGVAEKVLPSLRLMNLNSMEIEVGQQNQSFDLQILNSAEQQKIFAEAIGNACYEFYCTNLK